MNRNVAQQPMEQVIQEAIANLAGAVCTEGNFSPAFLNMEGREISGKATIHLKEGHGAFHPTDGELLPAPPREAILKSEKLKRPLCIRDVKQCTASKTHWHFVFTAE